MEDKVKEIKAEIFDITRQQEELRSRFNSSEKVKAEKVSELAKLEQKQTKQTKSNL